MNKLEQLEEELKQAKLAYQMAAQMSGFKASFLARTSHELRSPLSSLIGIHQIILSDLCESPEEEKEFVAKAYQSALNLLKLIDEIINVSKIEHGSNSLEIESLPLSNVFARVRQLTHLVAANRNLKLKIAEPDPALYVLADYSRLVQSVANLVDSGIALQKEGTIKVVAVAIDSNFVEIQIDLQCQADCWLESHDVIATTNTVERNLQEIDTTVEKINLSPKMKFMLSQTLLETMGGSLKLLDLSSQNDRPSICLLLTCKRAI